MIKIDNSLLQEIGLGGLPEAEKDSLLKHIYETLEMRVGMRLADQMSNQQLDEFEQYFEAKDDAGAFKWLETNFPNYKDVVQEEFDKLRGEVQSAAPQIVAASQQPQHEPGAFGPKVASANPPASQNDVSPQPQYDAPANPMPPTGMIQPTNPPMMDQSFPSALDPQSSQSSQGSSMPYPQTYQPAPLANNDWQAGNSQLQPPAQSQPFAPMPGPGEPSSASSFGAMPPAQPPMQPPSAPSPFTVPTPSSDPEPPMSPQPQQQPQWPPSPQSSPSPFGPAPMSPPQPPAPGSWPPIQPNDQPPAGPGAAF